MFSKSYNRKLWIRKALTCIICWNQLLEICSQSLVTLTHPLLPRGSRIRLISRNPPTSAPTLRMRESRMSPLIINLSRMALLVTTMPIITDSQGRRSWCWCKTHRIAAWLRICRCTLIVRFTNTPRRSITSSLSIRTFTTINRYIGAPTM